MPWHGPCQDLTVDPIDKGNRSSSPNDLGQANTANASHAEGDDTSRLRELESAKAALDLHARSVISLRVTGWVAEQVLPCPLRLNGIVIRGERLEG